MEMGDIQVFANGYRDKPQIYTEMKASDELVRKLEGAGFRASARLLGAGLAAARDQSAGVRFRGVEVAQDARVTQVQELVSEGKWLDPGDLRGVVLGSKLAQNLGVKVGDELVVLSQGADGSMANELYRVRGLLRSVSGEVDQAGVYINAAAFRELLVLPRGAHQIIVRRPKGQTLEAATARVQALLKNYEVKSWRQLMPTIASYLENAQGMITIMMLIIYLAIALVILNAMLMAVFERIREFGVLKALGMGPGAVLRLVLTESLLQAALAIIVASLLAVPAVWYLSTTGIDLGGMSDMTAHGVSFGSIWRSEVGAVHFVRPILVLLVVVLIAVIYPSIKAAFISPVSAMQHR
jgi:ABC-type lipoprotein release transport system permease subunit